MLGAGGPQVELVSAVMRRAWAAFCRSGDPSVPALSATASSGLGLLGLWPPYDEKLRNTAVLGSNGTSGGAVWQSPYETERLAWQMPSWEDESGNTEEQFPLPSHRADGLQLVPGEDDF